MQTNNTQAISKPKEQLSLPQMMMHQKTISTLEKYFNDKAKSEKFASALVSMYNGNPDLQKCTSDSIYYAAMKSAELGLPINNLGLAYIIPYGNKAQFQISFRGYIRLAMQTGQLEAINIVKLTDNYAVEYDEIGSLRLVKVTEKPINPNNIIGYFGYLKFKNGFSTSIYRTKDEIERHARKFSKSYNSIWKDNFDAMAEKTIIKRLLNIYIVEVDDKYISEKIKDAINVDQAVIENGSYKYIDNPRTAPEHQEAVLQLEKAFAEYSEDATDDDYDAIANFVKSDDNSTEMFTNNKPSALVD